MASAAPKCEKNHIRQKILAVFARMTIAPRRRHRTREDVVMTARFNRRWALASRANLGLALTLLSAGSALAARGTPEQRTASSADAYRLCPGVMPSVRAITACQRR